MLRSVQNGLADMLSVSFSFSSDEEDDDVTRSSRSENTRRAERVHDEDSYSGSDTATYDSYNETNESEDEATLSDSEIEDDEDSGRSTASRRLRKLCYQLSTDDKRMTEIELEVASLGSADKDISDLLATNTVVTKLSLIGPSTDANIGRRRKARTLEETQKRRPSDKEQRAFLRTVKVLCKGWAESSSIQHIQIQDTEIDREVANVLGTALSEKHAPLQTVTIKKCNFVGAGLAVLFVAMQHNPRIQSLVLHSCDLRDGKSDIVAAALPLMQLRSLALIDANLSLEDLDFLYDNIERSPKLTMLNLSQNRVRKRGIKSLVSCLTSPQQRIQKISLISCGLDDYCVGKLARGLIVNNTTVSCLNLSNNPFGDAGARELKRLLEKNHEVKELSLDGCRISRELSKGIADGLRYNNSFLKSIFSETTSMAILESVDFIEKLGSEGQKKAARVVSP